MIADPGKVRLFRLGAHLSLCLAMVWLAVGCSRSDTPEVSLEKKVPLASLSTEKKGTPLRIGMGAMITPKEGYIYYKQLKDYLEEKLDRPIHLVDRENYDQVNKLLKSSYRGENWVEISPDLTTPIAVKTSKSKDSGCRCNRSPEVDGESFGINNASGWFTAAP